MPEAGRLPAIDSASSAASRASWTLHGVDEALSGVDGLMLTGGDDVAPPIYGEQPHERSPTPSRPRTSSRSDW
jgi:gamma-glutamyl-gamma-aminobutyrate hydrolase PuuD